MADAPAVNQRPDIDISDDINDIILRYPPTASDHNHIHYAVQDGLVALGGHVKTPISRRFLLNEVPNIEGVRGVDVSRLYDDETIRIEVGRLVPQGVFANVQFGNVVLSGKLPDGTGIEALAQSVGGVPGVKRVVASF